MASIPIQRFTTLTSVHSGVCHKNIKGALCVKKNGND